MNSGLLTLDALLCLLQLSPHGVRLLLERGQGGLLLIEGGLCVPSGHLLRCEDDVLLHEGLSERRDDRLHALELGLLRLERFVLLLQRRRILPQLGRLRLDLLGLMLSCGSLHVTLVAGLGELLLPHVAPLLQVIHQDVDFAYPSKQAGVVFLKPVHPGELVGQLVAFVARHLLQPL